MGDGLGWFSQDGLDDVKAKAIGNAKKFETHQAIPHFSHAHFQAYVIRTVSKPGGDLEITIGVPPVDKWEAFKLSDAAGLMLHFDVGRDNG